MSDLAQFVMPNVHSTELLVQARFSAQYNVKATR